MRLRFAAFLAAGILCAGLAAKADSLPPLAGSVSAFSLFEPSQASPGDDFKDGEGRLLNLSDLRGKVVLLNFWAVWCAPCKNELASLDRLQAKMGNKDFAVLPVSIDDSGPAVSTTYATYGISDLGVYLAQSSHFPKQLGVEGVPTSFLIDRGGRIVGMVKGAIDWDTPEAAHLVEYYLGGASPMMLTQEAARPPARLTTARRIERSAYSR